MNTPGPQATSNHTQQLGSLIPIHQTLPHSDVFATKPYKLTNHHIHQEVSLTKEQGVTCLLQDQFGENETEQLALPFSCKYHLYISKIIQGGLIIHISKAA
ncbi:MAG TPA: hypothetical protein GYA08_00100 [Chloroflexi bacterium]|nr:hypothetical protein [Chloroflexota bacterium]